jgi:hypothetical protein
MEPSLPRYHFNVIAGSQIIHDAEGTELPSLDDAELEAISDARSLMSQAVLLGRDISERVIQICDSDGEVLTVIAFRDSVKRYE